LEDPRHSATLPDIQEIPEAGFSYGQGESEAEAESFERGWTSYVWLLWEKRRLLFKVAFRALFVGILIAILIPPQYTSTVRIMPPEQGGGGALLSLLAGEAGGSGGVSPGLASLAGSLLGSTTKGAIFISLARSRTVEDRIISRYNLQKVYQARYKQDARSVLEKRTSVDEDRKSGVLSIKVTDVSPQRARDLAQAYVEELDRLVSQVSTSAARRERIFIEQRLAAVKNDLEKAEQQFSTFASQKGAPDIKEQAKATVEAGAVLQGQLIAAQAELQGLEQIYTNNNVRVRSLKARVDELQDQLRRLGGKDTSPVGVPSSSNEIYPSIRELPLLGVQWTDLYRTMRIQETVYELLSQQYELTRIQEAKEIPTIRVIDPANIPERKSWPPRTLIVFLFTSFSLILTAGCIVGSAYWQKTDPHNPGKLLGERVWNAASRDLHHLIERLPFRSSRLFSKHNLEPRDPGDSAG
jgi:uncharacterized protein involved in exopolysaccharide biosynthesis